jgi:fructose-bisphosphate aldolase/2-amino-3,7-dideoxy-D-threo-hept-6-ulosonate synthase
MDGGAAGISIGRNAFRHPTPDRFIEAAAASVPEGRGVEEALEIIKVLGTGGSKP